MRNRPQNRAIVNTPLFLDNYVLYTELYLYLCGSIQTLLLLLPWLQVRLVRQGTFFASSQSSLYSLILCYSKFDSIKRFKIYF